MPNNLVADPPPPRKPAAEREKVNNLGKAYLSALRGGGDAEIMGNLPEKRSFSARRIGNESEKVGISVRRIRKLF